MKYEDLKAIAAGIILATLAMVALCRYQYERGLKEGRTTHYIGVEKERVGDFEVINTYETKRQLIKSDTIRIKYELSRK